jgi:hypothetical protein
MNYPVRIGMDTSKSAFQLHGVDENEVVVVRRQFRRTAMSVAPDQHCIFQLAMSRRELRSWATPNRRDRTEVNRICFPGFEYFSLIFRISQQRRGCLLHIVLKYPSRRRHCVYRKPKHGRICDEVRPGWQVT